VVPTNGQSLIRAVCGLIFPFDLAMIILKGVDLFTSNNSVPDTRLPAMTHHPP
jgi:formate/nitrite transporter FocA (FNT family)